ncbi:protein-L-isoaspartate O-methyltransferase family protein [Methylobacterium persicinum]|uniref:Protein-L-isoaspartate O-methyltransferase n=1 Tax=Methylobacterium persicinum TaxID=374426 RepID=A0ABU0HLM4_9HYPH|nr:methyltransferase domain-containing protein [Methylobacterium persicinum]MDQ0443222.1 protein-L-isoaspartate(D-aspartate) O-methyltransferase [Methylobacterium persicinum]GJE38202.1 Protein-L-isoaspartate O-methyltransferase [Methylobacterium persicinum]
MSLAQDEAISGSAVGNAAFVLALREKGHRDTAVLSAMERVPREAFAPPAHREQARRDIALPLPCGATMTAPSSVATMLSRLRLGQGQRVMEIGTGSGYVTALLDRLGAGAVLSLERYRTLAEDAAARLGNLPGIHVVQADALAPALPDGGFDRILVNGCVKAVPPHWLAALEPDGRLVTGLAVAGLCRIAVFTADGACETGPPIRLAALVPGLARVL